MNVYRIHVYTRLLSNALALLEGPTSEMPSDPMLPTARLRGTPYYHGTGSAIATEVQLLQFPYIDSSGFPTKIGIVFSLHSHAYMQKMTEIGGVIIKIFE